MGLHTLPAQIYLPTQNSSNNSNVGIGGNSGLSNPSATLEVDPNGTTGALLLHSTSGLQGGSSSEYLIKAINYDNQIGSSSTQFLLSPDGSLDLNGELDLRNNLLLESISTENFFEIDYPTSYEGLSLLWNHSQTTGHNSNLSFRFGATTSAPTLLSLAPNGNLGVGTEATSNRLHIQNTSDNDIFTIDDNGNAIINHINTPTSGPTEGVYGLTVKNDGFRAHDFAFQVESGHGPVFSVGNYGQVLIGLQDDDEINKSLDDNYLYNLYVARGIRTERVRIDIASQNSWADHVFEPGYELLSLSDLENYIQQNRHLPGIPSAEEVVEDGVNVAEINKLLLEKVEELTLHVIRLEKKIKDLSE